MLRKPQHVLGHSAKAQAAVIVMASAGEAQGGRNQRSDWDEPWFVSGGIPHARAWSGLP